MSLSLSVAPNPSPILSSQQTASQTTTPTNQSRTSLPLTATQAAYGDSPTINTGGYVSSPVLGTTAATMPLPLNVSTITPASLQQTNPVSTSFYSPSSYSQNQQTVNNLGATTNSYMLPPAGYSVDSNGNLTENTNNNSSYSPNNDLLSTVKDTILGDTSTLAGEGDVQTQLNSQFGVDQKEQDAIDAYNQYNIKKTQYDQNIASIYDNPTIGRAGADAQASEVSRVQNADLANLAVISTAAQGNYQGALDIVQRKLDAQFQPLQTEIDNLGKFVDVNNADLTDSQKADIQKQQYQLQNNLDLLKTAKTSASQFALQQGITNPQVLNAIDAAQTPEDAYAAVGMNGDGSSAGINGGSAAPQIGSQYQSYVSQTEDGTPYVSQDKIKNLTPFQQEEAARQYAAAGIPVLTTDQTTKVQNIDVTRQNLDSLQALVTGTDPSTGQQTGQPLLGSGVLGRIGSAIGNTIGGLTQSNPNIASFNNYRLTAINTLQSLGAGSGGSRINASEIATAVDNLPKITDNIETAQAKLNIINGFLNKWNTELIGNTSSTSGNQTVNTSVGAINTNW